MCVDGLVLCDVQECGGEQELGDEPVAVGGGRRRREDRRERERGLSILFCPECVCVYMPSGRRNGVRVCGGYERVVRFGKRGRRKRGAGFSLYLPCRVLYA